MREEVSDCIRLESSKLNKDMLRELVQAPKVDKSLRLSGEPSYRVLRHPIADDFNYMNPGVQGQR